MLLKFRPPELGLDDGLNQRGIRFAAGWGDGIPRASVNYFDPTALSLEFNFGSERCFVIRLENLCRNSRANDCIGRLISRVFGKGFHQLAQFRMTEMDLNGFGSYDDLRAQCYNPTREIEGGVGS